MMCPVKKVVARAFFLNPPCYFSCFFTWTFAGIGPVCVLHPTDLDVREKDAANVRKGRPTHSQRTGKSSIARIRHVYNRCKAYYPDRTTWCHSPMKTVRDEFLAFTRKIRNPIEIVLRRLLGDLQ